MSDPAHPSDSDTLAFDVALELPGFRLSMAAELPLHGITAITGPSGSGKTTLLRVLGGLQRADHGVVRLGGRVLQDATTFVPPEARGVGYVFQEPRLFPHLSIVDNLAFGARRRGVPRARLDEIVDLLDLAPLMGRAARALSGGEARRVALGRALASGPSILLLDEPMTGLDLARKAEILPHIARAALTLGLPALFVSHASDEVLAVADRCLVVAGGRTSGWTVAPARVILRVVGQNGDKARLALEGGATVDAALPEVRPGARWSLAVTPEVALLVRGHTPDIASSLILQASVARCLEDGLVLTLNSGGQSLKWPFQAGRNTGFGPLSPGDPVSVAMLALHLRPEPDRRD